MASERHCGALIFMDVLLSYLADHCSLTDETWVRFDRRNEDRVALLQVLASLACTSEYARGEVSCTAMWAALRLASHDVEIGGVGMSTRRKRKLVLQQFDINMAVFSKSWKVGAQNFQTLWHFQV